MTLPQDAGVIKGFLEENYQKFHHRDSLVQDPLGLVHEFKEDPFIWSYCFMMALFSYGRVEQIIKNGQRLADSIRKIYAGGNASINYVYRFQTSEEISAAIKASLNVFQNEKRIMRFLNQVHDPLDLIRFLRGMVLDELGVLSPGLKFLLGAQDSLSTNKRFFMFLRWMVRNDELDLGYWDNFPKSSLIYPLDVHLSRYANELFPDLPQNPNYRKAYLFTAKMRQMNPEDPLKYDFSLCQLGMTEKRKGEKTSGEAVKFLLGNF